MKKTLLACLLIFVLSILPLMDFFRPGFPITHDGQDHIARIANFYQNLAEGNIIPRWAANLNWGYGHPVMMFLYPLPSYFASLFHGIGFSLIDSTKLVFIVSFIISGFAMFLWIREECGDLPGLLSAGLYMVAPYRFVDLYVRGAIGEHVAFIFPPLALFFIRRYSRYSSVRYLTGLAISITGLILSHNAISLMFIPIIFLYFLYLIYLSKSKKIFVFKVLFFMLLGFGMAAFYWLPAFFEGKYTLRDIVTNEDYASRFVQVPDFFSTVWSYGGTALLSKQVGIVHWLLSISGLIMFIFSKINKKDFKLFLAGSIGVFLVSLYIMTPYAKILWDNISILQKFQFPWRFLSVTVFATAVAGGALYCLLPRKLQAVIFIPVILFLLLINSPYWKAKDYLDKPEGFYSAVYNGTTDTGESSPVWSVRFMEKRPRAHMEILEGKAVIRENGRKAVKHSYSVSVDNRARLRENTLYFPGWKVLVDGSVVPVEFQDPASRGLMTFWVDKGTHKIEVIFTETRLRIFANLLSAGSVVLLGGVLLSSRYRPGGNLNNSGLLLNPRDKESVRGDTG